MTADGIDSCDTDDWDVHRFILDEYFMSKTCFPLIVQVFNFLGDEGCSSLDHHG
jgi:hypothetical protein